MPGAAAQGSRRPGPPWRGPAPVAGLHRSRAASACRPAPPVRRRRPPVRRGPGPGPLHGCAAAPGPLPPAHEPRPLSSGAAGCAPGAPGSLQAAAAPRAPPPPRPAPPLRAAGLGSLLSPAARGGPDAGEPPGRGGRRCAEGKAGRGSVRRRKLRGHLGRRGRLQRKSEGASDWRRASQNRLRARLASRRASGACGSLQLGPRPPHTGAAASAGRPNPPLDLGPLLPDIRLGCLLCPSPR